MLGGRGGIRREGRPVDFEARAPRTKFGLPDYDAVYREIQETKAVTLAAQDQIIALLRAIGHKVGLTDEELDGAMNG